MQARDQLEQLEQRSLITIEAGRVLRAWRRRNAGPGSEDHFDLSDRENLHQGIE